MLVMTNTHFFGTGAVVNPTGKIDDGKFEMVVIKPYPWYYLFHMVLHFSQATFTASNISERFRANMRK